jgi:hypothetical protein
VGDWKAAEAALGTVLPSDFKQLVETYGSGELCGHLYWFNPFYERPMHADVKAMLDVYRQIRAVAPDECVWPPCPAPGGVLPWTPSSGPWSGKRLGHPDDPLCGM